MALQLPSSPCSLNSLPPLARNIFSQSKSKTISIRFQVQSSSSGSSENTESTSSTVTPPSDKSIAAAGVGFGSTNATSEVASKKKPKGKRERASVIRRAPLAKPTYSSSQKEDVQEKERSQNENGFLLAWIGLGGIILLEGIVLAASGFLPEEWDKYLVKYLYPSFTPTVFLFVAGTVVYGVQKYLQNEKPKNDG